MQVHAAVLQAQLTLENVYVLGAFGYRLSALGMAVGCEGPNAGT
jgi:hypothetical protein